MTDLESALVRLGGELEFPPTPDVAEAVRRRLAERQAPRRSWLPARRTLVIALVAVALAVGAAFAVPPARSAILDFLGLRGATVERVDTLPQVPERTATALELGRPVALEDARGRAAFGVLVPGELGPPDDVYYSSSVPGGRVSLVYEPDEDFPRSRYTGVGLLVTEFRGDFIPHFVSKLADQTTRIEEVSVGRDRGIWLEGGPHSVLFGSSDGGVGEDTMRLAGNTLLVERGNVLVRVEGSSALTRERAVEIAESLTADEVD
jgi:hypothetical protein